MKKVDVAIIGAGTSGIAAFEEALKFTHQVAIIDHQPLGTTCARIGCMPSKTLIQVANNYFLRNFFLSQGIIGADQLHIDIAHVLAYVRKLRDEWVGYILRKMNSYKDHLILGEPVFIDPYSMRINGEIIRAEKIIFAVGSRVVIPKNWGPYQDQLLTIETIFEQKNLQQAIGVAGLGPIGVEFAQAFARLGLDVAGYDRSNFIARITDPEINKIAIEKLAEEFAINVNQEIAIDKKQSKLTLTENGEFKADQIFYALGMQSNYKDYQFDVFDIELNENGLPAALDFETLQVRDSHIFLVGDANEHAPVLHEAANEGRIAGFNACHNSPHHFNRYCPLTIIFTEPNIAQIGASFASLNQEDIIVKTVNFYDQGRAKILGENKGQLNIYIEKDTQVLVGAELFAPAGEHLAHLLAWAIQKKFNVRDLLQLPFYHPTVEESIKHALAE